MKRENLVFRVWQDDDQQAITDLFRDAFGLGHHSDPGFFDWQYRRNPAGRAIAVCCETRDAQIVAQYAVIPVLLLWRGRRVTGSLSLNTATHSDYRRRGLFVKTAETVFGRLSKVGIDFTYGFPSSSSYHGFVNRLNFTDMGRPRRLFRILDLPKLISSGKVDIGGKLLGRLWLNVFRSTQTRVKRDTGVQEVRSFDHLDMASLWESATLAVAGDPIWLNWRYLAHPLYRYSILQLGSGRNPEALAVYRIHDGARIKSGLLMEVFLSSDVNEAGLRRLLDEVGGRCREEGCAVISCLVAPGSRKERLLRKCGFVSIPWAAGPVLPFIFRDHHSEQTDFAIGDVDLSYGMWDNL